MKKLQIYKVQNNLNKKVYIGITNQGYRTRFRKHISDAFSRNSDYILHRALRKYGVENFSLSVLEECLTIEELKEREKYYISLFDSNNREKGYNMTSGGDGTFDRVTSEYTKKILSEKAKGRKSAKALPVRITNIWTSETKTFDNSFEACLENKWSDSYLHTMRKKRKGAKEFIVKNVFKVEFLESNYVYVKKELRPSDFDIKAHMNRIQELSKNARELNKEEYSKIQKEAKLDKTKVVQQLDFEGNLVNEYLGVREAADKLNVNRSAIQHCLKGRNKTAYGYKWKFKD